jgi:hypothetical protein
MCSDLRLATDSCRAGVGTQRTTLHDNTWDIWLSYCAAHRVNLLLVTVPDPIPCLQVFAQRFRNGRLAKNGDPLRACTVEDTLRAIGQMMASMGATDQRLIGPRLLNYCLSQQLVGY